jgi:hypothetical protein
MAVRPQQRDHAGNNEPRKDRECGYGDRKPGHSRFYRAARP